MTRINLTLRPAFLFGLELLARDRRTSLSQAAEYALGIALREYVVDGRSVLEIATEGTMSDASGKPHGLARYKDGVLAKAGGSESGEEAIRTWTFVEKMAAMPDRLKTAEEKFVSAVLAGSERWPAEDRYGAAVEAFRSGLSLQEAIDRMKALAVAAKP